MGESRSAVTLTAADIGGTHVRFAAATIEPGQRPVLGEPVVLQTASFSGLSSAWNAYKRTLNSAVPDTLSVCFAGPVRGDTLQATNSHWVLNRCTLAAELGLKTVHLMNDFGAMAHGVALLKAHELETLSGPDRSATPSEEMTTVIGPGTGLGVAILSRRDGQFRVIETEGGHIDFAPLDELESAMLRRLRERFLRVSVERIVSGPGLNNLVQCIAQIEQREITPLDDAALWQRALSPDCDDLLRLALQRFCMSYGSVAGDLALATGASRVVLVGGLTQRLVGHLPDSHFAQRFCAKGRYQSVMADISVQLARFEQLGLLGAAAGYMDRLSTR
ncbi:MAG: glucokinase [Lysobacterales bacterium]